MYTCSAVFCRYTVFPVRKFVLSDEFRFEFFLCRRNGVFVLDFYILCIIIDGADVRLCLWAILARDGGGDDNCCTWTEVSIKMRKSDTFSQFMCDDRRTCLFYMHDRPAVTFTSANVVCGQAIADSLFRMHFCLVSWLVAQREKPFRPMRTVSTQYAHSELFISGDS